MDDGVFTSLEGLGTKPQSPKQAATPSEPGIQDYCVKASHQPHGPYHIVVPSDGRLVAYG